MQGGIDIEEFGRNLQLFNRIFASQTLKQVDAFIRAYESHDQSEFTEGSEKSHDFVTGIRRSKKVHSDIRHMLIIFGQFFLEQQIF